MNVVGIMPTDLPPGFPSRGVRRAFARGFRGGVLAFLVATTACGDGTSPEPGDDLHVAIEPEAALLVGLGARQRLEARVTAAGGRIVHDVEVSWTTLDPAVVAVDDLGWVTAAGEGVAGVVATVPGDADTVTVEVFVPEEVTAYLPGTKYTGRNGYVEYLPGELPVILSAPHGGDLEPDEIPDRSYGVVAADRNTAELTRAVADALEARTGARPHVIINRLHRSKLDANREIEEAAQGSPFAALAWAEYHDFIEEARTLVETSWGAGLFFDMHGHGHPIQRLELGYLLSASELALPDSSLNALADESSVRSLAASVTLPFSDLIRGPLSLGTLLSSAGVRAVPSTAEPSPGADPYFSGGYNTRRHGSLNGGDIDGIQIEHHYDGIRDTDTNRRAYAEVLASVIVVYLAEHRGLVLQPVGVGR